MINFNAFDVPSAYRMPAAAKSPQALPFRIVAPAVITTICRGCRAEMQHVGEVVVGSMCDGCLDLLSGDAEMTPRAAGCRPRAAMCGCNDEVKATTRRPVAAAKMLPDDADAQPLDAVDAELALLDATPTKATRPDAAAFSSDSVGDEAAVCATCADPAVGTCPGVEGPRCGRLVCRGCADGEGLCPQCGE